MKCPEYNPCAKDGQWCFVGALIMEYENEKACADACAPMVAEMAAPVMRDMSTVKIPIGNGQSVEVLKENIERQIRETMTTHLFLPKEFI